MAHTFWQLATHGLWAVFPVLNIIITLKAENGLARKIALQHTHWGFESVARGGGIQAIHGCIAEYHVRPCCCL
jgi:hypothetical protein